MPPIRKVRIFLKNIANLTNPRVNHIFSSELILEEDEDSMDIALIQASIPPLGLTFKVLYNVLTGPYTGSWGVDVIIPIDNYTIINDLETAINTAFANTSLVAYGTLNTYLGVNHSGGYLDFTSSLASPDVYVYAIEITTATSASLLGFPIGTHTFPGVPSNKIVAPNQANFTTPTPALYIHTDLNTPWRNLDNIDNPQSEKGNIFAKVPITTYTGFSYFYDSTPAFHLNVKTGTLSGFNFYLTDLNKTVVYPLKDWGLVLEVSFRKKPDYEQVITNQLLKQTVDYLRLLWLSNPPKSVKMPLEQPDEEK